MRRVACLYEACNRIIATGKTNKAIKGISQSYKETIKEDIMARRKTKMARQKTKMARRKTKTRALGTGLSTLLGEMGKMGEVGKVGKKGERGERGKKGLSGLPETSFRKKAKGKNKTKQKKRTTQATKLKRKNVDLSGKKRKPKRLKAKSNPKLQSSSKTKAQQQNTKSKPKTKPKLKTKPNLKLKTNIKTKPKSKPRLKPKPKLKSKSKILPNLKAREKELEKTREKVSTDILFESNHTTPKEIGIDELIPSNVQPRQNFPKQDLEELANSIKEKGILQPLLVRPASALPFDKSTQSTQATQSIQATQSSNLTKSATSTKPVKYEIVAGERRWRAAQLAQLDVVPCLVRVLTDNDALQIGIIENVQRSNLNPIEEGDAYRRLMDEFSHTQETLARQLGKSRSHIANMLRLASAPVGLRGYLVDGRLTAGHARALLPHPKAEQLAGQVVARKMSVRATEQLVASYNKNGQKKKEKIFSHHKGSDIMALEKTLSEKLGLKVVLHHHQTGNGKIAISYHTLEQLDDVIKRLSTYKPNLPT